MEVENDCCCDNLTYLADLSAQIHYDSVHSTSVDFPGKNPLASQQCKPLSNECPISLHAQYLTSTCTNTSVPKHPPFVFTTDSSAGLHTDTLH